MSTSTPTQPPTRHDRLLKEQNRDTYRPRGQLKGPARCPDCGAVYHRGRWSWTAKAEPGAEETRCNACRRIADNYPAGEVTLAGSFAISHKDEILNLARNIENVENREHPMNRIIAIREYADRIMISTTDVHLPRRIGKAIQEAWKGDLDIYFDEGRYFTRTSWRRD